jgi:hypothetical protein
VAKTNLTDTAPPGELILYASEDDPTRVECRLAGQTLWLTQAQIAELFGKDTRTINEHLRKVLDIYATSVDYPQLSPGRLLGDPWHMLHAFLIFPWLWLNFQALL